MINSRLINTKVAGGGGCTDIVDNYDPFDGNGVALYQLNGDATDVSGNYNGTATNVTYGAGVFGQAGVFNGSSSEITISSTSTSPVNFSDKNYTISAWIKTTQTTTSVYGSLLTKYGSIDDNRSFGVFFRGSDGKVIFLERATGVTEETISNASVNDGAWHNIVVVKTSNTKLIYIDGSLDVSKNTTFTPNSGSSEPLRIGSTGGTTNNRINGSIDQVRIFNTALTPLEVEALYTEELCICDGTVDTLQVLGDTSCIATYQLDGNANDLSGNYSGTPTDVSYGVGEFDLAGVFNGSSSHIDFPSPIPGTNTPASFSGWFKFNSGFNSGVQTIIGAGNMTTSAGIITLLIRYASAGNYYIEPSRVYNNYVYYTDTANYPTVALSADTWYNVVFTYGASNEAKIYLNGSLISTTYLTIPSGPTTNSNVLALGQYRDNSLYFNGSIDQVRIFNKALTPENVQTLWNETACGYTYPPFDLRSYGYNSAEDYDYSADNDAMPGLFFKPDGTKFYFVQSSKIYQYSLSTAWDVSTATPGTQKTGLTTNVRGAWMSNDGLKFYHTKPLTGQIFEYTLSTAWDTSTATNTNTYTHGNGTNDAAVCFNYDGTKMYITISGSVYQYSLSTPWSTATASYDSKSLSMGVTGTEQAWDIYINEDGTKFFNVIQTENQRIDEYDLSTSYDISTGYKIRSFDYTPYGENSLGFYFKPDGGKLYIGMSAPTNKIKTFDLR